MKRHIIAFAFTLLALLACSKNEVQHTVPNAPVYYRLYFNSAEGIKLKKEGMLRITQLSIEQSSIGYGGLLFVSNPLVSNNYFAYDLCCPYEVDPQIKVEQVDLLHVRCPQCKSVYAVVENQGLAISGPAAKSESPRRLRNYHISSIDGGIIAHN